VRDKLSFFLSIELIQDKRFDEIHFVSRIWT